MIIPFIVILVAIIVGVGSTLYLKDDNIIEERSEEVIQKKTGIEVDLSPKSPENPNAPKPTVTKKTTVQKSATKKETVKRVEKDPYRDPD